MNDTSSLSLPQQFEEAENAGSNPSPNPAIGDVIAERLSRRDLLRGGLAAAAMPALAAPLGIAIAPEVAARPGATPSFDFKELTAGADERHHVAAGYNADVLIRWGDKVLADAPAFDPSRQTAASQALQFGYNNDFLAYIPLDGSRRGLLVVNHEYTNAELMLPGLGGLTRKAALAAATRDIVDIEMMAHGGSVIEIARGDDGKWSVVEGSKYARRVTAMTEMRISGPAAGHERMKTKADPSGTRVLGMLNNCAGGVTPWGTWLTCEENFNGYFWNKAAAAGRPDARALQRYGAPGEWFAWGRHHERFDLAAEPNEVNRFGWVVEIDPLDPASVPVKRTALGRFKHEGACTVVNEDGRLVVYSGDDQAFDYVYRFVTAGAVDASSREKNRDLLDSGTLAVARFAADGSGEWLPLVHGQGKLTAENGFADQGDVVIHARLAADLLGATKMDRPEDVEVNPVTGKVYVMLTSNARRTAAEVEPANPRAANAFGHIIELIPDGGDHAASRFRWEVLVRCGDPSVAAAGATFNPATTADGWFAMPDNALVDAMGRLWIATDGNSPARTGRTDGVWAMETEGAARGTSKLFFRVPLGAELCGPATTPDLETFFVAVQHPGEADPGDPSATRSTFEAPSTRWPDFKPDMPPRPSIVAITRRGGGKIGT